ncbi:SRPBCC family protein [Tamlana fucoidanivorans]|uniref:SRPBCC family protein n=1 Tax=Allotamlana fucoidanivorans TaxID=2583814 RepID=A0A5C4SIP9_9FLAO|nr:SRPBCC family protein [Tamlana fucoidanivorans]TNJ43498.1 hypothetical protein FGF67_11305 [Tamlana fucoidanivorans]
MKGELQGQNELIIEASADKIWEVLIDGTLLSQWMTIVKHTTSDTEALNTVRHCDVEMNGKLGKVSEKCILFNEKKEIGWIMLSDEFGISKMFGNYGFSFTLVPVSSNKTKVINKGYGDPKGFFSRVLNLLIMKRMSSRMRIKALHGIKQLVEQ